MFSAPAFGFICIVIYQTFRKVYRCRQSRKTIHSKTMMRMEMKKNRYLILQGDEDHCNLFLDRLLNPDDYQEDHHEFHSPQPPLANEACLAQVTKLWLLVGLILAFKLHVFQVVILLFIFLLNSCHCFFVLTLLCKPLFLLSILSVHDFLM